MSFARSSQKSPNADCVPALVAFAAPICCGRGRNQRTPSGTVGFGVLAGLTKNSETDGMDSLAADEGDEPALITTLRNPALPLKERHHAFQRLHELYSPNLLAFLRSQVGTQYMRDVEQTVWLGVWKNITRRFDGKCFRAWLFEIGRNEAINHHRRNKKPPIAPPPPPPLPPEDDGLRQALEDCLKLLDKKEREVIEARLEGSLTNEEIKEQHELPSMSRLYSLVSETKSKLAKCVKEKMS